MQKVQARASAGPRKIEAYAPSQNARHAVADARGRRNSRRHRRSPTASRRRYAPGRRRKSTTSIASARRQSFEQAVAADPQDSAAYRGLASVLWLSITFRRGNMTVDDYLGGVARSKTPFPPPPAETTTAFNEALERALTLARKQLEAESARSGCPL